jgi:hypothetical protein
VEWCAESVKFAASFRIPWRAIMASCSAGAAGTETDRNYSGTAGEY